jgi:deoxyribodipyrimidine photo-lyase
MAQALEKVIYWFRQDLRLHDNKALTQAHAMAETVLHVTHGLSDELTRWGFARHSLNRQQFRRQGIEGLRLALENHGQTLVIFETNSATSAAGINAPTRLDATATVATAATAATVATVAAAAATATNTATNTATTATTDSTDTSNASSTVASIIALARQHNIQHIFCETLETPEEEQQVQDLLAAGLIVKGCIQSCLYEDNQLPFSIEDTPDMFTAFRQAVENSNPYRKNIQPLSPLAHALKATVKQIVKPMSTQASEVTLGAVPTSDRSSFPFSQPKWFGDEHAALQHLSNYFSSQLPQTYKLTRNDLTGLDYSTHFSPWLANGALSPRTIWQSLQKHEREQGANDSTYWIGFELLWREHFRLMARKHGAALFRKNGLKKQAITRHALKSNELKDKHSIHIKQSQKSMPGSKPAASSLDYAQTHSNLQRWQTGETDQPFINAAMRELVTTGFLSNRLRQIVASYAIHNLGIDWRAGAAWFEHCLVDYDVHSNQGNWAYIAGVGTDPRGGRQFNIDKQMKTYDPEGSYQKRWQT